jgi:hypothetical protein
MKNRKPHQTNKAYINKRQTKIISNTQKTLMDDRYNRMERTEKRISYREDRMIETIQSNEEETD